MIRGLRIEASVVGADVYFRHVSGPDGARLAIYLDGELEAVVDSLGGEEQRFTIPATLTTGYHQVAVLPLPPSRLGAETLRGAQYGRRALLSWEASAATDLRRYLIYQGNAAGEAPAATPVATIEGTEVEAVWGRKAGDGRVSIFGAWDGDPVNAVYSIGFDGAGKFRENILGIWSDWRPIESGVSVPLANGIVARFHDAAATYSGSSTVRVGPRTFWRSEVLAEGTWQFGIRGEDAAGNLSDLLGPFALAIVYLPDAPTNVAVAFDPAEDDEVSLTWDLPTGVWDAVEIFANYSNTFGELREDIIEDGPWESLAGDAEGFSFSPSVAGLWRFSVRVRDAEGRLSDDGGVAEVDTRGIKSGVALNEPEQLVGVAGPAGIARLSWRYRAQDGGDLTGFRVYIHDDPDNPEFVTPAATIEATAAGFGALSFTWDSGVLAGERWFTLRAIAGSVETTNVDMVSVVPDSTAPVLSGDFEGAPI